jgi:Kef-type K+ transport system membrane component KefB
LTATQDLPTLLLIALAAVAAPVLAELSRRVVPVPEVVIQILLGVLIGPSVLALTRTSSA